MNILVINLTRFGDLLQSQPVFHELKAQGHSVGLVCLNSFASATDLLNDVDYVLPLHGGKILAKLDVDWHESLVVVYELLNKIQKDFPVDVIINFSATVSSRLLANFLGKGKCEFRGYCLDAYGFGYCADSWATYLLGSTLNRINCSFNIVDMFYKTAQCTNTNVINLLRQPTIGVLEEIKQKIHIEFKAKYQLHNLASDNINAKADDKFHNGILTNDTIAKFSALYTNNVFKIDGCNGFISFQLGASDARRQWPTEYFVQLGNRLWSEFKICPILLGTNSEKNLGQEYAKQAKHNFIDCIGKTNIPELAALVSLSRLLVTNDTGTMHLAAGLGIPILAFFLATAQVWDTAPYAENACCLEPALDCHPCSFKHKCHNAYACTKSIDAETATAIVLHYLKTNKWEYSANGNNDNAHVRIWSTFKDEYGFVDLKCLSQHEFEDRTLWIRIQRHFVKYMLDAINGSVERSIEVPWPDKKLVERISPSLHEEIYKILCAVEGLLFLLMQHIKLAKQKPELKSGRKIITTYNNIKVIFSQIPHFASLEYFWTVTLNEHAEDIDSIFENTVLIKKVFSSWRLFWEK